MTEKEIVDAGKEMFDAGMELSFLFFFSCGVAWLFRRRLKDSYKGRTRKNRILHDVINCICTGMLSVFAAVILSAVWPELSSVKMQICMCGLMSGYGMSFVTRLISMKLGLSNVDVSDEQDIEDAKKGKKK